MTNKPVFCSVYISRKSFTFLIYRADTLVVQEVTQAAEVDTLEPLLEGVTRVEQGVGTPAVEEATPVHPLNKATLEVHRLKAGTLEQPHPHSKVVTGVPHPNRVAMVVLPRTASHKSTPVLLPGSGL